MHKHAHFLTHTLCILQSGCYNQQNSSIQGPPPLSAHTGVSQQRLIRPWHQVCMRGVGGGRDRNYSESPSTHFQAKNKPFLSQQAVLTAYNNCSFPPEKQKYSVVCHD